METKNFITDGTSFATPIAAGVVALMYGVHLNITLVMALI